MHLNILPLFYHLIIIYLFFLHQENTKANFEILMTITPRVNMNSIPWYIWNCWIVQLYPLVYFIFAFQDLQNSVPWGPPFVLSSGL